MEKIKRFVKEEEGATAIEYGLVAGLVAIALAGAMMALKNNISTMMSKVGTEVSSQNF